MLVDTKEILPFHYRHQSHYQKLEMINKNHINKDSMIP